MTDVINRARSLRSRAIGYRERRQWDAAERAHKEAIQLLRVTLEMAADEAEGPLAADGHIDAGAPVSPYVRKLAVELSQQWGSLGGTYRSARDFRQSVDAYDEGYRIQTDALYGHEDSYNLVQRLIARFMLDPAASAGGRDVAGVNVRDALGRAKDEVERQLAGSRMGDEWALADRAVLGTLTGSADVKAVWADLRRHATQQYVLDATRNVLAELSARLLEVGPADRGSSELGALLGRVRAGEQTLGPPLSH